MWKYAAAFPFIPQLPFSLAARRCCSRFAKGAVINSTSRTLLTCTGPEFQAVESLPRQEPCHLNSCSLFYFPTRLLQTGWHFNEKISFEFSPYCVVCCFHRQLYTFTLNEHYYADNSLGTLIAIPLRTVSVFYQKKSLNSPHADTERQWTQFIFSLILWSSPQKWVSMCCAVLNGTPMISSLTTQ